MTCLHRLTRHLNNKFKKFYFKTTPAFCVAFKNLRNQNQKFLIESYNKLFSEN